MKKTLLPKGKTGPTPERIKIEGAWESAVGKALEKKRPAAGWPEPDKKKARK